MRRLAQNGKLYIILTLAVICFVFGYLPPARSDDAGTPYSGEPEENIGTWYDETWEAGGFYSTGDAIYTALPAAGGETWELSYRYTPQPEGKTVSVPGENVSLPADAAVVEWNVTGHIHFSSGL
ncbi:MAG: hypothetical protein V1662_05645 [Candidatus Omnitrophota bacterium]